MVLISLNCDKEEQGISILPHGDFDWLFEIIYIVSRLVIAESSLCFQRDKSSNWLNIDLSTESNPIPMIFSNLSTLPGLWI